MMRITRVTVEGDSDAGAFHGTLKFGPGVQVVSGRNRMGKSIAFEAIVWCMGVEHIYGVQPCDNSIFSDAPRHVISLGEVGDHKVLASQAEIELLHEDGRKLTLRRAIVGAKDRITYSDGEVKGDLVVGRSGAMADPTVGFQATFRKWAGLPEARLMTSRGTDCPIYLENLAPLFLIEQLTGWSDIQAEQIYRYGLQEIADAAFEYVLGLDAALAGRLQRQRNDATSAALKEEARVIAADYESLLKTQGWTGTLATAGKLADLVERWSKVDLVAVVKDAFNFDGAAEIMRLVQRVDSLRLKLTKGKIDTESTAEVASMSMAVVGLKERRHDLQLQLATLRAQWREQERLLRTVESRLKSARDLARLKKEGIGILPRAECPTCHQVVDPEHLELTEQSGASIDTHVTQLDHQRLLLEGNLERMRAEVVEATARANRLEDEFAQAEHALRMVNQTVGPAREAMVKTHADLLAAERELDRERSTQSALEALQERLHAWVARARQSIAEVDVVEAETALRTAFLDELRAFVVALGCAGVTAADAPAIILDQHYVPELRGRWLRSYGSASDRARLIAAYLLALASVGRHHLGFVALDEPLQQNPDQHHKCLFLDFLLKESAKISQQVVMFTFLSDGEVADLRKAGVAVQTVDERFLKLRKPSEPAPTSDKTVPD
jgi:hypothetical protein